MENCVPKTKMIGVRDLTILMTSKRGATSMHVYQLIKYFWRFIVKKNPNHFSIFLHKTLAFEKKFVEIQWTWIQIN